ncbi:eukaryotic mitochondrial regulator protein-domain-containing protein [Aspergillus karnatakaensis]|uniref:mitochondrial 37S ribosomal protein mS45 n=1 Tax=Aspergillus karnatakaensis TaxID=1810916 RepID=UPI003CCDAD95
MPPRIQTQRVSNTLLPYLSSSSSPSIIITPSSCTALPKSARSSQDSYRNFSSSQPTQTKLRREMFNWLQKDGTELKNHIPGSTNYMGDMMARRGDSEAPNRSRPFPHNPAFVSEPVLSEELRNDIYEQVMVKKKSVRAVSVDMGVDMRRVAAVCRLVALEKRMRKEGKPLALPYARSVHEMIPTTPLYGKIRDQKKNPHESINDLPSHRLTDPQIFYPVSESRQFTRVDAGRVFSAAPARLHKQVEKENADLAAAMNRIASDPAKIETVGKGAEEQPVLQPADVRIPHPQLVAFERDKRQNPDETIEYGSMYDERLKKAEDAEAERRRLSKERRERNLSRVQPEASRFEFRIKDVVVSKETTGSDGRGARAPGRRYGVPSYDRRKGEVKIPTKVEV